MIYITSSDSYVTRGFWNASFDFYFFHKLYQWPFPENCICSITVCLFIAVRCTDNWSLAGVSLLTWWKRQPLKSKPDKYVLSTSTCCSILYCSSGFLSAENFVLQRVNRTYGSHPLLLLIHWCSSFYNFCLQVKIYITALLLENFLLEKRKWTFLNPNEKIWSLVFKMLCNHFSHILHILIFALEYVHLRWIWIQRDCS